MAEDRPLIVNLAEARAVGHSRAGVALLPEPEVRAWPEIGVNVRILQPGQPNCRYHSQPVQEDFLVLQGECLVILDGEERPLKQWDFVHCPPGTEHVFVGAGAGPCAILMIGSRRLDGAHYPVSEVAARYDASAKETTDSPAEAYADWADEPRRESENAWPLEPAS